MGMKNSLTAKLNLTDSSLKVNAGVSKSQITKVSVPV